MRIALCTEYPIEQFGGTEVLVQQLIRMLAPTHEIFLVSNDTTELIERSPLRKLLAGHFQWDPTKTSRATAKQLARQLADAKIDLAHFHLGGNYGWGNRFPFQCPIYFVHRLGIPCLSTVHLVVDLGSGYCGPQRPVWYKCLLFPIAWWGKLQQLRAVRFEIAVSQHDLQKLQRWYWPLRKRYVQIYHSRLENSPPAGVAREPIILNVGHLAWRKGQAVLANAFAQIAARYPGWSLQFAGPDSEGVITTAIQQMAKEHKLEERILLLGKRTDTFSLMQRASIYVQPSYWEALGLALQEAMFCRCPCIGSRAGGIPELIQDGETGLLTEAGNVAQLSDALEKLMGAESLRQSLGQRAAASILQRGMTAEAMIKRHVELYEAAVGRN